MSWERLLGKSSLRTPPKAFEDLAPYSRFLVGGPADLFVEVWDQDELASVLQALPRSCPAITVGLGSNVLFRDAGFRGAVIRLRGEFETCRADGQLLHAGGGCPTRRLSRTAARHHLGGLEFLDGIPGTVGGAICMNAGAFERDVAGVLCEATVMHRCGRLERLLPASFRFGYRHALVPPDAVIVGATFVAYPRDPELIAADMRAMDERRRSYQPVNARTCGSTFKNPPGDSVRRLIEASGAHRLRVGVASLSELNSNFMIAGPGCKASDLEQLGEQVRAMVRRATGVEIEWEVCRYGEVANEIAATGVSSE
jgi:UDP-N-acetylmuramate dehydrogenase